MTTSTRTTGGRTGWSAARRVLTVAFFLGVGWLLVSHASEIDWREVASSLQQLPLPVLAVAAAMALASHLLISCFDLLGRHYTGHRLPAPTVVGVNAISYAFNLNLGSLVGGVAFRFRLYSRLGLRNGVIARIMSLSMLTNWLGYLLVGGLIFMLSPPPLPDGWKIGADALPFLGAALVAVVAVYAALCLRMPGRTLTVRGHELAVPGWRMAVLQLAMSSTNWLIMGGIVWTLLEGRVDYVEIVAVLLIAAIAGVITHVPAGLGVLEAVFVALLAGQVPQGELLAALLAYRGLYYLVPLGVATVGYAVIESRARKTARLAAQSKTREELPRASVGSVGNRSVRTSRRSAAG